MGTRGYWAIVYKGKVYLAYNHFDSYPQRPGLGWTLVSEIRWGNLETWKWALDNIKEATGIPTEEDKQALRLYTDLNVSNGSDEDWYCLTRKCQGSITKTLQSGYFFGSIFTFDEEKLVESLGSQEWGYAVDLDKNEFRTFARKEIHFWRFSLGDIPLGTFSDASIGAFNRIADGDEFESYHDSGNDIVQAYARFFEEEKRNLKKKQEEEKKSKKAKLSNEEEINKSSDNNDGDPMDAKLPPKTG